MKKLNSETLKEMLAKLTAYLGRYGRDLLLIGIAISIGCVLLLRWNQQREGALKRRKLFMDRPVTEAVKGRYDHRAITVTIGDVDAKNPLIREGQHVDVLMVRSSQRRGRQGRNSNDVTLFMEDLEVLSVERAGVAARGLFNNSPPAGSSPVGAFDEPSLGPDLVESTDVDFKATAYVTLRVTSLEAMLIVHGRRKGRLRILPRTNGAKSHLDYYDVMKVGRGNFDELFIKNLSGKPEAAKR